jgi:prefoldin subunit 5
MGSLNGNALRKKELKNKENNYPEKLKDIDSRIQEINKNASRLAQSRR